MNPISKKEIIVAVGVVLVLGAIFYTYQYKKYTNILPEYQCVGGCVAADNKNAVASSSIGSKIILTCPEYIQVEQNALSTPEGWIASGGQSRHPFVNIMFSDGTPADNVILAPTKQSEVDGVHLNTWQDLASNESSWFSCRYNDTNIVISKKIAADIKECEVEYDPRFSVPVVKRIECRK